MGRHRKPEKTVFQGTEKLEIANNPELLPANPSEEDEKELSREDRLLRNLELFPSVQEAAIASGYSPGYAKGMIYRKFHSPRFISKLQTLAKGSFAKNLPRACNITSKALKLMEENLDKGEIENVTKLRQFQRDVLKINGILHDDPVAGVSFVNIQHLQALIQGKMNLLPSGEED